tara:strand:- start:427 stop:1170 length:744 start_codon:yes stop_codon:yes gene_type:complete
MKLKIDFEFIHYAMVALAGHRFWFLPLLALVWIMFQYFLRVRNGVEIINLLTIQYTIIGLPLTALAIFFGVRIIAGELDERSLEIAYTIPGGSERLWLAKLFSAFLILLFTTIILSLSVCTLFKPFPLGMVYGALQDACFYMILAMAMGALFRNTTTGVIGTIPILGLNILLTDFGENQIRFLPFFNPHVFLEPSSSSTIIDGGFTSPEELLAWTIQNRITIILLMSFTLFLALMRANKRESMLDGI